MDAELILHDLNAAQRAAVNAPLTNLLILAGAGSGKTRVLVHRIAWLITQAQVAPLSILAVTFTNKAAKEMRERIADLLTTPAHGMWVGTFHGLAHRLLRAHWQAAQLPETFQIIDSDDQYRLLRRIMRGLEIDEEKWPIKRVQWFINGKKDEGLRAAHIESFGRLDIQVMLRIYEAYEQACALAGLVDFAEILLRCHELLRDNTELLQYYQRRFQHILVDEFQDTNTIQYAWLRLLTGQDSKIWVVGDDDQSIYGWRGAKIENIQRFSQDFADTQVIRLEQNYRSTATILSAANALIAQNAERLGKDLWTDSAQGELISVYAAFNEIDEARFIVDTIKTQHRQGMPRNHIALLYRSNAQSRILEETLLQAGVPYRVYGGQRFFERAEIKDGLAYLRLLVNRHDDAAFERVINTPTRGIGERTLLELREHARTQQVSLWQASIDLTGAKQFAARASNAVVAFLQLIDSLDNDSKNLTLHQQTQYVLRHSGLFEHVLKEKSQTAQNRLENLEELINATQHFHHLSEERSSPLVAFLAHTALESGEGDASSEDEECVQLMTLHTAKGLEFPLVFICGMEEGLFPSKMALEEMGRLEEERRLLYVGMTRAMQKLYLCYAECRRLHGSEIYNRASRFIAELPKDLLQEVRLKNQVVRPLQTTHYHHRAPPAMPAVLQGTGFKVGQRVNHRSFGEGVIVDAEGQGEHTRVQVRFKQHGSKWLVLQLAKLEALV